MTTPAEPLQGTATPPDPYTWDSGPVHHPNPAETPTTPHTVHPQFLPTWETNPPTPPTPRPTPDPNTLNWLLRKASLDVVHTRRLYRAEKLDDCRRNVYGSVLIEYMDIRDWLADIIREHGQEGTE